MSVVERYSSMSNEHDPKYDPKFAEDKPEDREVRDLVVSPTGTQMSPENEIIELDAHLGEPKVDHTQYKQPELRSQDFAVLADGLGEVGAYHESSLLEAERKMGRVAKRSRVCLWCSQLRGRVAERSRVCL